MSLLEIVLSLVFDVLGDMIGCVFEAPLNTDTWPARIFWTAVLLLLGGLIWWELH